MAKAFIDDTHLTDIADAIRATLDESRQYLPSEMAAAIQSIPIMAQLNRKKYFQSVPAGAASGYATIEQIEGNTVKFNQLFNQNLTFTYSFTSTTTQYRQDIACDTVRLIQGHKYFFSLYVDNQIQTRKKVSLCLVPSSSTQFVLVENDGENYQETIKDFTGSTIDYVSFRINNYVGKQKYDAGDFIEVSKVNVIDLTAIFGSGNEPTTVADFEAWRDQNGLPSVAAYNAGELLSVKMSGMQTEDSSQQTLDTLPFDVTTITGINTATNVREVMFADGMKQADYAGTVKDTLDLRSDTATVNVGSRAYQSGDESDTDVLTDGTTTYYALTTPIEYTDLQDGNGNPLNPRYKVEQGGTEQVLPVNTSTPTTVAPTLTTTYTKDNN